MWIAFSALTYVLSLALVLFVIMQRKPPANTLAWILAIVLLPVVGALVYLWFGYARVAYRVERRRRSNQKIADAIRRIEQALAEFEIVPEDQADLPVRRELQAVSEASNAFMITYGNDVQLSSDPKPVYDALLQAIHKAAHYIHIEYYIFRSDTTGTEVRDALIAACKRGVEVRVLIDGIGSWSTPSRFFKPLREAGGSWSRYLPITPFGSPWHWNLRNHRKIVVIDGRIGFSGSANIGDEYLHRKGHVSDFDDIQISCRGPVVQQLQEVFAGDWFFATRENLFSKESLFPLPEREGPIAAQVVDSGPVGPIYTFYDMLCAAIHAATKSVRIITPYFIPDQALALSLRTAALRGVKVEILVACHLVTFYEHLIWYAGRSFYDDFLPSGIRIYEYLPAFLHSKGIIVDDSFVSVGTANMDMRSFFLNFEVNMNIYSSEIGRQFNQIFEEHRADCKEITLAEFSKRSFAARLLENTMRVFSPIA